MIGSIGRLARNAGGPDGIAVLLLCPSSTMAQDAASMPPWSILGTTVEAGAPVAMLMVENRPIVLLRVTVGG